MDGWVLIAKMVCSAVMIYVYSITIIQLFEAKQLIKTQDRYIQYLENKE